MVIESSFTYNEKISAPKENDVTLNRSNIMLSESHNKFLLNESNLGSLRDGF